MIPSVLMLLDFAATEAAGPGPVTEPRFLFLLYVGRCLVLWHVLSWGVG